MIDSSDARARTHLVLDLAHKRAEPVLDGEAVVACGRELLHEGHSLLALVRRKRLVSERLVDMGVVDRVRRRARALDGVDGRLAGSEREKVARVVCERGWWGPEWLPRGGALEGGVYVLVARVLVRVVAVIRARVASIFCRGRVAKSVRCSSKQSRRCGHPTSPRRSAEQQCGVSRALTRRWHPRRRGLGGRRLRVLAQSTSLAEG